MQGQFYKLILN